MRAHCSAVKSRQRTEQNANSLKF